MKMNFDFGIGDKSVAVKITSARPTKWFFGRDVSAHCVMDIEASDGTITYSAKLPVMLQDGESWEFGRGNTRTVTEGDQLEHWNATLAKFPGYDGDKELTQEAVIALCGWLRSGNAECRVIPKGVSEYNGIETHNAVIVKPLPPKKEEAPLSPIRKEAKASIPPKRAKPATQKDAWYAYVHGEYGRTDSDGARFWETCDNIVGHDASNSTPEEWAKCVAAFSV